MTPTTPACLREERICTPRFGQPRKKKTKEDNFRFGTDSLGAFVSAIEAETAKIINTAHSCKKHLKTAHRILLRNDFVLEHHFTDRFGLQHVVPLHLRLTKSRTELRK